MSRRVNEPGGQKRRRRGPVWVAVAVAFVTALLYWDQAALLYVISTLAMCGLLIVVAFSDLEGSRKELKGTAGQDEVSPAGGGELATAAALPRSERRVARRKRREAA